jgi:hypothetical protein
MSIPSITALAVARNLRAPTKSDAGVVTDEAANANEKPSLTEILAKTVPIGLVTAYTAFIAVVAEVVSDPTAQDPEPQQYLWIRWLAFGILVSAAAIITFGSYRNKAGSGARLPLLEIAAVTVSAAAWGLAIPESPVLAAATGEQLGLLLLALIAFLGVAINLVLSNFMKSKA